ncbi:MAG: RNA polymerase sigma factor [bacterium]
MKNPLADKILFLKVKSQDPEAYGRFYDLYVNRIYRFIFFKVNSSAEAQDITSEVFLKCWQYIKEGKEIKNLNSFVYIIARNKVIDFYRQKSRETTSSINDPDAPEIMDEAKDLLLKQMQDSDLESVLAGMSHLKDEYKEVVVLRFMDELSIGEMAEILNKTQGSVRVLLHRALKALKENVNEQPGNNTKD